METMKNVLVPVDFSSYSSEAVRQAAEVCRRFDAQLHLVHVVEEVIPPVTEFGMGYPAYAESVTEMKERACKELANWPRCVDPFEGAVTRHILVGSAFESILELAKELPADLIVMGTHGRTGFQHFILGSVAEQVVRRAPCGVLVVRPGQRAVSCEPTAATSSHTVCPA